MKESAPQAREKKRDWYLLSKLSSTQVGVGRWSKVQSENKRYLAFLQKLSGLDPYVLSLNRGRLSRGGISYP